jgi:hypothetical protein
MQKHRKGTSMLFLLSWGLGLIFAVIHVLIRKPRILLDKLRLFILYQMVFAIGISGLVGFLGHCLNFEQTARSIGWAPHRQFQFELGAGELGWAIAGFLSIAIRKPLYWLGVSIAPSVMCLLSAGQHTWEAIALGNYSSNNLWAGAVDLIGPLTLIILFGWYFVLTRKEYSREG